MAQGLNEPVAVAPNRYTVKNYLNQTILLNEKGEEIGDVSKVETFKKSYMVVDGKLFNYDLKMIYDYKEAELAQYKLYDNCAIFMNEDGTGQDRTGQGRIRFHDKTFLAVGFLFFGGGYGY